jgi:outer membrane immunogenic protein
LAFQYDSGSLLLYCNSKTRAGAVASIEAGGPIMKCAWTLVIGASLFACAAASPAFAADLTMPPPPTPPPAPAAVPALPPVYNWSGFFVGGHLGYGWGAESMRLTPGPETFVPAIAADPRGVVAGVQYGTNWQFDRLVLGTESDISFTDIRRSQTILTGTPTVTNTGEQKLPWFGTTRVRAGYTIQDNLLIYATGGLANGTAKGSFSAIGSGNGAIGSRSKTLWGWNVGGGLEYGLGPWSAKVEYLHYDIGTLTFYTIDFNSGALIRAQTKFAGDMVRVGVNYRFAWTPWQLIFGR